MCFSSGPCGGPSWALSLHKAIVSRGAKRISSPPARPIPAVPRATRAARPRTTANACAHRAECHMRHLRAHVGAHTRRAADPPATLAPTNAAGARARACSHGLAKRPQAARAGARCARGEDTGRVRAWAAKRRVGARARDACVQMRAQVRARMRARRWRELTCLCTPPCLATHQLPPRSGAEKHPTRAPRSHKLLLALLRRLRHGLVEVLDLGLCVG